MSKNKYYRIDEEIKDLVKPFQMEVPTYIYISEKSISFGVCAKEIEGVRNASRDYSGKEIRIYFLDKEKIKKAGISEWEAQEKLEFFKNNIQILNEIKTIIMKYEIEELEANYKKEHNANIQIWNQWINNENEGIEKEQAEKYANKLKGIKYDKKGNIIMAGLIESGNN